MRERPKRASASRRNEQLALAACVSVLVTALFAAPAIANVDFGHAHSDETCPHIHELDSILARAASSTAESTEQHLPRLLLADAAEPQVLSADSIDANPIRGPPGTLPS